MHIVYKLFKDIYEVICFTIDYNINHLGSKISTMGYCAMGKGVAGRGACQRREAPGDKSQRQEPLRL